RDDTAPLRCGWAMAGVKRIRPGRTASTLSTGAAIDVGDTITTASNAAAILVLGDRSVAVMQGDSDLTLPRGTYNDSGSIERVKVGHGRIWFAVRKLSNGQKFEVETGQ